MDPHTVSGHTQLLVLLRELGVLGCAVWSLLQAAPCLSLLPAEVFARPGGRQLKLPAECVCRYAYPSYFTEELVDEIANNPKVTKRSSCGAVSRHLPACRVRSCMARLAIRMQIHPPCCHLHSTLVLPTSKGNGYLQLLHSMPPPVTSAPCAHAGV